MSQGISSSRPDVQPRPAVRGRSFRRPSLWHGPHRAPRRGAIALQPHPLGRCQHFYKLWNDLPGKREVWKDWFKSTFLEMAPKAMTQNQATEEAAAPAMTKMQHSQEAPDESGSRCCSSGAQERATSATVHSSKTGLLSSPFHSQKAGCKTCRPVHQLPQKRTVASRERNRNVSLSSRFILFSFSKSAPLIDWT